MERSKLPETERKDFYLFVDEFQNFVTQSFATILSEARKYRLNLTLAHQYLDQLTDVVRDAVFGNVGTLVSFRVGNPDAEHLGKQFEVRPEDLQNLPAYNIYLKLMIDGTQSKAFSAITFPSQYPTYDPAHLVKNSRERYGRDARKKIDQWLSQ